MLPLRSDRHLGGNVRKLAGSSIGAVTWAGDSNLGVRGAAGTESHKMTGGDQQGECREGREEKQALPRLETRSQQQTLGATGSEVGGRGCPGDQAVGEM